MFVGDLKTLQDTAQIVQMEGAVKTSGTVREAMATAITKTRDHLTTIGMGDGRVTVVGGGKLIHVLDAAETDA